MLNFKTSLAPRFDDLVIITFRFDSWCESCCLVKTFEVANCICHNINIKTLTSMSLKEVEAFTSCESNSSASSIQSSKNDSLIEVKESLSSYINIVFTTVFFLRNKNVKDHSNFVIFMSEISFVMHLLHCHLFKECDL